MHQTEEGLEALQDLKDFSLINILDGYPGFGVEPIGGDGLFIPGDIVPLAAFVSRIMEDAQFGKSECFM